jgi:hypothetical protein
VPNFRKRLPGASHRGTCDLSLWQPRWMSLRTESGDVIEVLTQSGRRSWVQYVGSGRYMQLVRVFVGSAGDSLSREGLERLVDGQESYSIEVEWHALRKANESTYVACMTIPASRRTTPPMRLFVAKSEDNPDGWMIKDSDGLNHSGMEYRSLFPLVDQSSLSVTDVPMTDTFLEMLDTGWTPVQAKKFLLG